MLNITGMENSYPKANQKVSGLRRAVNVYRTHDMRYIPRSEIIATPGWTTPNDVTAFHNMSNYDGEPLIFATEGATSSAVYQPYLGSTKLPLASIDIGPSPLVTRSEQFTRTVQSYRVNNTTYWLDPYTGLTTKYDGVEVMTAGVSTPFFATPDGGLGAARYIKAIRHRLDFDNNDIVSEYVMFTTSAATVNLQMTNGVPATYEQFPTQNLLKTSEPRKTVSAFQEEACFFVGTATYDSGNSEFDITSTETNIDSAQYNNCWLLVAADSTSAGTMWGSNIGYAIALKVKSFSPLTLDAVTAKVLNFDREWEDVAISSPSTVAAAISYGCKDFMSFWEGTSATGGYGYRAIFPFFPASNSTSSSLPYRRTGANALTTTGNAIPTSGSENVAFSISPTLGDWYDSTNRPYSPNSEAVLGGQFNCFTKFQGMFVWANDDVLWFSDNSIAGNIAQISSSNFLIVGDKEDGPVITICGTSDFLFVGRSRRNYIVTGNVATGNYRVQQIVETDVGPYSNNCALNIKDTVIFLSAVGVFQVMPGGRCVELSKGIQPNFLRFDGFAKDDDIVFEMEITNTSDYFDGQDINTVDDYGMSVCYDSNRALLFFSSRHLDGAMLVLNVDTGEFFEWNGMVAAERLGSLCAINGVLIYGQDDLGGLLGAGSLWSEDPTSDISYTGTYPIYFFSSWLTAGEPSLEKQVLQLKLFGHIIKDPIQDVGIKVQHYKDWNISTKITDSYYTPVSASLYSHKKRLTADKALAVSVGFSVVDNTKFEIESMEVEFMPIQQGMKR